MFEYKIQQAWDSYHLDFGLGRILTLIMIYNMMLGFYCMTTFGYLRLLIVMPVILSFLGFFFRRYIVNKSSPMKTSLLALFTALIIVLNYYLVGELDLMAHGYERLDHIAASIDQSLFSQPVALLFEGVIKPAGLIGVIFYDLMMLSYMFYYLMPIYGAFVVYRELSTKNKFKISRYIGSFLIFFLINYTCYLLIPITGPQFYLREFFTHPLPLSAFGQTLWMMVRQGQTTFIDCFPSGHTGISLLTTYWFYKINHQHRYFLIIVSFFIICATLSMRYHYTIDLIMAVPLVILSQKLSWFIFPVSLSPHFLRKSKTY